ncbi:MICOS complex subunit MIC25 isoform X2 [Aphelocoma coerulescens]|uniref:MICOS complex subunit MIC25 isoform X2 n=1 Tax=Aphelocoma coerulescens TaxID=39617 RepID=UPI003604B6F2
MGSGYVGRRCEGRGAAGSRCGRGARWGQATLASMGGSESSHGGRRVTFGLDEREQVRVLQGIRLTEDVVNRMKESSQGKRDYQRSPRASNGTAPSSLAVAGRPRPTGIRPPMASDSAAEQELYRRYEQEQALVQEELIRLAKREREAASEAQERNSINEERQRTAQLGSFSSCLTLPAAPSLCHLLLDNSKTWFVILVDRLPDDFIMIYSDFIKRCNLAAFSLIAALRGAKSACI